MRRFSLASLTGVLVVGCAAHEVTGPPADSPAVVADMAIARIKPPTNVAAVWLGVVDDAIARLVPALGPAGEALGTTFRTLRDASGGTLDAKLLAARKQFDAIAVKLPADRAPDAEALRLTFDALSALAGR